MVTRTLMLAGVLCAAAALATAQTPDATAPASGMQKPQGDSTSTAQQSAGPAIPATLDKSVDSKKAKSGDEIVAKTSVGLTSAAGVQIPEGSKVIGHITDAKAKSKGDPESALTFAFEKIILKNGQEIPFHAVAQAIGMGQNPVAAAFPESGGPNSQTASNGMKGGASPSVGSGPESSSGSATGASSATPQGAAVQDNSGGRLSANATGVVNLKGINLNSESSQSIVSSDSKSVKLDSGTQMLLRVISQ
jgi:hypothetical protein